MAPPFTATPSEQADANMLETFGGDIDLRHRGREGGQGAGAAEVHNWMIESSQVIAEMIAMAKDMQAAMKRDEELGLNPDEIAFYDALAERPEVLQNDGRRSVEEAGDGVDGKAALQHRWC